MASLTMDQIGAFVTFSVGSDDYVASQPQERRIFAYGEGSFVTVLEADDELDRDAIIRLVKDELFSDDALHTEFLQTILLVRDSQNRYGTREEFFLPIIWEGNDMMLTVKTSSERIKAGPYIVLSGRLWPIFKLYQDTQQAFLVSTVPSCSEDGHLVTVSTKQTASGTLQIAVPSRSAVSSRKDRLLSSFRVAVKDAFDMRGFQKTLGSKAYCDSYAAAQSNAPAVQCLIDRGAQIVGRTKMSMFMSREEPAEAVDFQAPWNPRGDGYQGPGGSSSGSAAAIAAYGWLDVAIGVDTNGSIRRPAQCNGCFGLRISKGIFPSAGMFTIFEDFDVPGALSLDLDKLEKFARGWYGDRIGSVRNTSRPRRMLYLTDDIPAERSLQFDIIANVIKRIGQYAMVEAEHISIAAMWDEYPPKASGGLSIHQYLAEVGETTFLYANYQSMASFRSDYMQANGHPPFVSQFVQWRWDIGERQSRDRFEAGMRKLAVYKAWFLETVMQSSTHDTIIAMPSETVKPNYRTTLPSGNYIQPAWHTWWIAPVLGAPEVTMPVGQVPYLSSVTGDTAHLPVNISLLGEQFSDMELLEFCKNALRAAELPLVLKTGSVI